MKHEKENKNKNLHANHQNEETKNENHETNESRITSLKSRYLAQTHTCEIIKTTYRNLR